ncbi:MAG: ketoacyl-ACP synthase III [Gammaproteobacteria bacterium]|nr:ketoacyl-ACP synthase III [Gammaproteobacteria bacterium]
MTYSRITGTGSYLPEKVVTNHDLEKTMETSDQWIRDRTGIKRRHIAADGETTSDLAVHAAEQAIDAAGIKVDDIDLIVVATTTPDKIFPATACTVQRKLGSSGCGAFDVQAVCSGFVYALDVADRHIRTGGGKTVLVIGAETLSRIVDWEDRTTAVLFGDGAGAVILQATDEQGIISTHIHSDGRHEELLHVPQGASQGYDQTRAGGAYIQMNGNAVFRKAVGALDSISRETLAGNNVAHGDLDWLVPHQANMRIITAAANKLRMPLERVIVTVDEHANTSAASIPLALDIAVRDGRIKRGQLVLLGAFGAGFTWGSALLRY